MAASTCRSSTAGGRRPVRRRWGGRWATGGSMAMIRPGTPPRPRPLYTLLEREAIPAFYARDELGTPTGWVAKMRASMARLTPRFSANRVVREYTDNYYVPAAAAYRTRTADHGRLGAGLLAWRQALAAHWAEAHFGAITVQTPGAERHVTVELHLGGLDPEAIGVELYAEPLDAEGPERHVMERVRKLDEPDHGYEYSVTIPATRPVGYYTPRLLPRHHAASVPLEASLILWQR